MVDRALAAEAAGNADLALMFFKISENLGKADPKPISKQAPLIDTVKRLPEKVGALSSSNKLLALIPTPNPTDTQTADTIPTIGPVDTMPSGVVFDDAARPTSGDVGFTPFFERNLRELRSPLPLTIFNEVWQDKAIIHYAEKRSKADENNTDKYRYTGYPYPCEYTQTYAEWSINHQGFLAALIKVCNYVKFAGWVQAHKKICDQLVTQYGFMTGLRYDINVRMNAFAHRVVMPDGKISISNISIKNEEIAQKIIARTRKFDELDFTENPYAKGGERKTWDPVTGQDPAKAANQANPGPSQKHNNNNQARHQASSSRAQSPGDRGPSGGRQGRTQGYKGNRWDGGYNERNRDRSRDREERGNERGEARGDWRGNGKGRGRQNQ
ncbi:hypothetical protein PTTG_04434 [Puccinia triticina 1-1 BBBD Race 1]|uniref:Uncharacterized protein n=1 Tax=Puccinia triticina (isolate 1-1 / race 1 (BBBD)) TaxID=630390 RepID=A0A180FYP2_PUCT1|nr:hypothetical protein PTTG_04434 [Puccinia triticina 1-1 BBBD Race 1]